MSCSSLLMLPLEVTFQICRLGLSTSDIVLLSSTCKFLRENLRGFLWSVHEADENESVDTVFWSRISPTFIPNLIDARLKVQVPTLEDLEFVMGRLRTGIVLLQHPIVHFQEKDFVNPEHIRLLEILDGAKSKAKDVAVRWIEYSKELRFVWRMTEMISDSGFIREEMETGNDSTETPKLKSYSNVFDSPIHSKLTVNGIKGRFYPYTKRLVYVLHPDIKFVSTSIIARMYILEILNHVKISAGPAMLFLRFIHIHLGQTEIAKTPHKMGNHSFAEQNDFEHYIGGLYFAKFREPLYDPKQRQFHITEADLNRMFHSIENNILSVEGDRRNELISVGKEKLYKLVVKPVHNYYRTIRYMFYFDSKQEIIDGLYGILCDERIREIYMSRTEPMNLLSIKN